MGRYRSFKVAMGMRCFVKFLKLFNLFILLTLQHGLHFCNPTSHKEKGVVATATTPNFEFCILNFEFLYFGRCRCCIRSPPSRSSS